MTVTEGKKKRASPDSLCGICGKHWWWHLQKHRGDDGHEFRSGSLAKRMKGRWKWSKNGVESKV